MEQSIIILTGIISALLTYIINNYLRQGAVRASSGLSLIIGLFFYYFPDLLSDYLSENIPLIFIGATFIGMVSSKILHNYYLVGIAGLIFSMIYLNTGMFFQGYGGALGTTAAISVLVSLSLTLVANSKRIKKWKASGFSK